MLKPIINPKLSLRARSLFYYYVTKGRVISADELWENKEVPEGRDAIRSAMSELKDLRYIKSVRVNVNGQWRTNLKFTDEAIKMLSTDDGISGVLYIDSYTASSYTTSTNIDNNPNGLLSIGASPLEEEKMAWNLDGEEKPKRKRFGLAPEEEAVGSVGKVEDRQARLNAKYKKPVKAQHDSRDRINTPEELWSTNDLVAEFYDLVQKAAPGVPSQVNGKYVATWVNKQVAEGTGRVAILKAMRMFFADPRSLHDTGIGKPLWQRFFGYYPTVHGIVTRPASEEVAVDYAAHEEKMLRLLGGE
jgi:hypothetical protein